ncbi:ATP phosphoribosyltransferase [hydrothermal vent metagenome]|uniref:ATP phosphoribosyltransferase n=1 Tax=hydrothermal vent metagenome TaxID=652676 RepID=A0A1W1C7S1_9ZZZZ
MTNKQNTLTIALAKGRILKETLPLLEKAGISIKKEELESRKLIFNTNQENIKVLILRATDVPVFVQHGVADLGVSGLDTLLEHSGIGIHELLDLKIAKCRLCVASPKNKKLNKSILKVATKYVRSARKYFQEQQQQVEIIKLYGAMELAPIVNLSDCIVDLVDTGNTLKANNLEINTIIKNISSRLIVNTASYKTKNNLIKNIVSLIYKAL